ncbi:hypothetical protein [Ammoniphilus sp. YIM 78166]|uniref:hypothetical protein n=1 Tax=Ammoniphilus sp. YIM 78166 TaxID=1644106 RepID=UPI001430AEC6|nr:hypothetical protein [Ammoniphilus sp. YIM 78166]
MLNRWKSVITKRKSAITTSSLLFLVVVVGWSAQNFLLSLLNQTFIQAEHEFVYDSSILDGIEDQRKFRQTIAEAHTFLNETVGWNRVKSLELVNSSRPQEGGEPNLTNLEINAQLQHLAYALQPYAEQTHHDKLAKDLNEVLGLIAKSASSPDWIQTADLIRLHRMLHDLDYWVFNYQERYTTFRADYWGVTRLGESLRR